MLVCAQIVSTKIFELSGTSIAFFTEGLDELKILNTNTQFVEVTLITQNFDLHDIVLSEQKSVVNIGFKVLGVSENTVFRKFITERLQRAVAIVKVPENKFISITGDVVDVIVKDYKGDLEINIYKGLVNLNSVFKNVKVQLFQGNVYASLKSANINVFSNTGRISINDKFFLKKKYEYKSEFNFYNFDLKTVKANVFLKFQL